MLFPQFSCDFGVFDSNVKFSKITVTQVRPVTCYELELFPTDCPGTSFLNGGEYPLDCGTLICAKPGQRRYSRLPFRCYYLHLETQDPGLLQLLDRLPDYTKLGEFQDLLEIFHQMLGIGDKADITDRLQLQSCICRLILALSRLSHTEDRTAPLHQARLQEVEKYIREHITEELSLASLAAQCNLSPTYFHRLFTNYFGKTPSDLVLECRISAAKAGLQTSNYSLSELAADCGFSSQAYFCYKFKQFTGKTPLQYRKEMLSRLKV